MSWANFINTRDPSAELHEEEFDYGVDPSGMDRLYKAGPQGASQRYVAPQGYEFDPMDRYMDDIGDQFGGADAQHPGNSGLTLHHLRVMGRIPLVNVVVSTRTDQVAEFCVPSGDDRPVGYEVRLRDRNAKATRETKRRAAKITEWLECCGEQGVLSGQPDTLEGFARLIMRDSLILDQCAFETVRTRGGKPIALVPYDAATIRRAKISEDEMRRGRRDPRQAAYVQLIQNKAVAQWGEKDLTFGVRRQRTDMMSRGYGHPELSEMVEKITSLMNAESFNQNNFMQGVQASGVLAVMSRMRRPIWNSFKRNFRALLSGVHNAHKMALLKLNPDEKESLQHIDLSKSNRDMEFNEWLRWLLRIVCAMYKMDPAEIGFQFGQEGVTTSLSTSGPGERIIYSKERGLRPLLRQFAGWINAGVVWQLDPNYTLHLKGLDAQSEKDKQERLVQALTNYKTLNEVRAEQDLPPIKGLKFQGTEIELGDLPLNPALLQNAMGVAAGMAAAQQQEQMMAQGGEDAGMEGGIPVGAGGEEGGEEVGDDFGGDIPIEDDLDAAFARSKAFG